MESLSFRSFVMDRGYDDNKMFLKLDELGQDYVIRLKSNRKLLYHNKWTKATELRNRRKGKVKTNVFYKGKNHEAYLSHVKVQITASRKNVCYTPAERILIIFIAFSYYHTFIGLVHKYLNVYHIFQASDTRCIKCYAILDSDKV